MYDLVRPVSTDEPLFAKNQYCKLNVQYLSGLSVSKGSGGGGVLLLFNVNYSSKSHNYKPHLINRKECICPSNPDPENLGLVLELYDHSLSRMLPSSLVEYNLDRNPKTMRW